MVTITKIGEEYNSQILEISGLSTDPKPVDQIDGVSIANGSTFKEIDTGKEYTYNESAETWHINKSASSGGGSGVDGEDGGYYTPGVTQPTTDTMQISFAPSKSDMPAVNPVTVNLPVSENSGQNLALDTTLTQSGKAADAKAVGDVLAGKTDQSWFERLLSKMGLTIEDLLDRLPKVSLTGDLTGISGDDYVNVTCHYSDEVNAVEFTDYAEIAYQGSSSMSFTNVEDGVDKAKNYKIKLYTDESRETKSKRVFRDWFATNNFHIKANFGDCTNFMNNMMMHYLTKSYQYLTPLPRDGARYTVDGFPILLYINDVFCGVRFWNLKQSDKVYGLNEEETDENGNVTQEADLCYQIGLNNGSSKGDNSGAFIYGNLNSGSNEGKNFADAHAEIDYYWEDRVWDKTGNHPAVLYDTVQWVSEASDEEFKANLEQYFDKEYLIHYFVMMYTCGMGDSICKNFNMLYFPDKGVWYATFWDMDFACGTGWGLGTTDPNINVLAPTYGASRLFTKLWSNLADEIKAKYAELRKTILTVEQVKGSISAVWGDVSAEWISANETAKYGDTSYAGKFKADGADYVTEWVSDRFAITDTIMEYDASSGGDDDSGETALYETGYIDDQGVLTPSSTSLFDAVATEYKSAAGTIIVSVSALTTPSLVKTVRVAEYDADKIFIQRTYSTPTDATATFTLADNTRFVRIGFVADMASDTSINELFTKYTVTVTTG